MTEAKKSCKTILLAEDNENDLELTLSTLSSFNLANEIKVVRDGAEVLDYLYRRGQYSNLDEDCNPVVILMDLKMPKVDGLQVLQEIKQDSMLRCIPVVMLTSSREESDLLESYRYGVNAYVVKPVDFEQFIEAIKQLGIFWTLINEIPALNRNALQ